MFMVRKCYSQGLSWKFVYLVLGQPETGIVCKFVAPFLMALHLFSEEKRCFQSHRSVCSSAACLFTMGMFELSGQL